MIRIMVMNLEILINMIKFCQRKQETFRKITKKDVEKYGTIYAYGKTVKLLKAR